MRNIDFSKFESLKNLSELEQCEIFSVIYEMVSKEKHPYSQEILLNYQNKLNGKAKDEFISVLAEYILHTI